MSNLSASLGCTGRGRVVLGHTLNTLQHVTTKTSHTVLSKFMILCWATFIAILGHMQPMGHGLDTPALFARGANASKSIYFIPYCRAISPSSPQILPNFPSAVPTQKGSSYIVLYLCLVSLCFPSIRGTQPVASHGTRFYFPWLVLTTGSQTGVTGLHISLNQ